ncbi:MULTISPECIES: type II toxin-antitoxin system RelE/ParE family toxin [Devosia]|uniref:type II toxin-antitoxin system RelE/ParE family toxin n=1 Tax=Devosia TaxID=46913 RepID=UPI000CE94B45|nr:MULTISPECIES: type II toxin-antitoxin system RelE/ParE family toxin [Devosia]AVF04736.1 hypothetical protein C4375_14165 [Devosia sp. I507]
MPGVQKPLSWLTPSISELVDLPKAVRREFGYKLSLLQHGDEQESPDIKRFGEDDRIAHLTKVVVNGADGNTYRLAATVEFEEGIWVIDVFVKKSSSGISTPQKDIERIVRRLKRLKEFRASPEGQKIIQEMKAEYAEAVRFKETTEMPGSKYRRK